jgi:type I restriction enzyme S subunit
MKQIPLNDESNFALVSGLWKGERGPLQPAKVLRSTNFSGDGLIEFADVAELDVESRLFHKRQLRRGDIIIERSGGGPKQPVGRVAFFEPRDNGSYFSSNFTTALRVLDREVFEPAYVALHLHALYMTGVTESLQRATTGIRNLDWSQYLRFTIPAIPLNEQRELVRIIGGVRSAYWKEDELSSALSNLKHAVMRDIFTQGLHAEAQKESEIGLTPESWLVEPIRKHHTVSSGGTPSRGNPAFWADGTIPWVKTTEVSYSTIYDTEERISQLGLEGSAAKVLPSGTLLMAMYGQGVTRGKVAILGIEAACNQACAAIFPIDDALDTRFLYHFLTWRYDAIRSFAHGGQQQNLNLDIVRDLLVSYPVSQDEQRRIVDVLDALDRKISKHRRKRAVLDELFKALLHKLTTGEIDMSNLDFPVADAEVTQ